MLGEAVRWTGRLVVEKFDPDQVAYAVRRTGLAAPSAADFARLGLAPYEVVETGPNLVTTNGLARIAGLLIGSGQAATATAARIGVGDGSTAASASDLDLAAAPGTDHRWFQVMDSSYPQVGGSTATFKATFPGANANFAWAEWGIDIGTPTVTSSEVTNGVLLNRKVASSGTKPSGASWVATAAISFS